ncbi:Helicase loader DnaI [bacterium endosymbiont of Bathymodiolus sp. 5 South]|nr:Helicase loader DnaI [bacterium endosymbiont of Bathymodiolus sp. 5 South]
MAIVTDYRLNANHNVLSLLILVSSIVTDYRLNANHNTQTLHKFLKIL